MYKREVCEHVFHDSIPAVPNKMACLNCHLIATSTACGKILTDAGHLPKVLIYMKVVLIKPIVCYSYSYLLKKYTKQNWICCMHGSPERSNSMCLMTLARLLKIPTNSCGGDMYMQWQTWISIMPQQPFHWAACPVTRNLLGFTILLKYY